MFSRRKVIVKSLRLQENSFRFKFFYIAVRYFAQIIHKPPSSSYLAMFLG